MKKICTLLFLSLVGLSFVGAEDWAAAPPGKARVVVYGDFLVFDISDLKVQVDDEKSFPLKITQKNVVLDLPPGRHYLKLSYPVFGGDDLVKNVGFFLAEGNVIYLQYYLEGRANYLHAVTQDKFLGSAKNRPAVRDPFREAAQ